MNLTDHQEQFKRKAQKREISRLTIFDAPAPLVSDRQPEMRRAECALYQTPIHPREEQKRPKWSANQ